MGLDQYGSFLQKEPEIKDEETNVTYLPTAEKETESDFTWRKHARLQQYMMELYYKKYPDKHNVTFNCEKLFLSKEDVLELQKTIENDNLPFCEGGFFWGHQFQEESMKEYKEQDLQFCKDALKWLDEGKKVYYECWW